jgi:GT2 family glycosyltransferase
MKLPKVLIFTVTYEGKDYCFEEFNKQFDSLSYPKECYRHVWIDNSKTPDYYEKLLSRGLDAFRVRRGNTAREAVARAQNLARKIALEEGYDYLLSIESDELGVPNNIVQHLIGKGKDVVGCLYKIKSPEDVSIACVTLLSDSDNGLKGTRLVSQEETVYLFNNPGLYPVNSCGLGCTLIRRSVFEKISFKYYPELKAFSDVFFANDVWRKGFSIHLDTSVVLNHMTDEYPDDR